LKVTHIFRPLCEFIFSHFSLISSPPRTYIRCVTEQILSPHLDTVNFYSHTDGKNVGGSGRAAQFLFPFGFPFVLHSTFFSTYAAGRRACAHSWRSRLCVRRDFHSAARHRSQTDRLRARQAKPQSECLEVDFSQAELFSRCSFSLLFFNLSWRS
jgi:hypothetical protein